MAEESKIRNIFVICKVKDYYNYFYTEKEINDFNKKGTHYYGDWENQLITNTLTEINLSHEHN